MRARAPSGRERMKPARAPCEGTDRPTGSSSLSRMTADPAPRSRFAQSTLIGEAFVGEGPNAAHLNVVIGRKGGPVETAWATSLATPRAGHVPFLLTLR